ncbi:hypothetical protein ABW19_dt0205122 [Dactylella cylindrospora]|nr:hypothetical protein ABW19_dt0205122 [Dactylella cylindrospora]
MASPAIPAIDPTTHTFRQPKKLINNNEDLPHFLKSKAHHQIVSFIQHFSDVLTPPGPDTKSTESRFANSEAIQISEPVGQIVELLATINTIIDQVPPVEGPRRFGNVAFRTWYAAVEKNSPELLQKYLPKSIVELPAKEDGITAVDELNVYLLGGFGSAQRLDYGTGHELSFFAFLCGIWTLGGFQAGRDELALVFKAFDAYLAIIRRLVVVYNLEPAGSHGVWGLDDHSFLPYIFGSAQLAATPEGMGPPAPGSIVEENTVQRERNRNMYFGAIGFIRDVKKGPFWEHSPYLYDISGAIGGWKKINQGMMKMYSAEVLGKFPVVQHFPFGSIYSWDLADGAKTTPTTSAPSSGSTTPKFTSAVPYSSVSSSMPPPTGISTMQDATKAPWSTLPSQSAATGMPQTTRLRTSTPTSQANPSSRYHTPPLRGPGGPMGTMAPPPSRTPATITLNPETTTKVAVPGGFAPAIGGVAVTTAPWAKAPTGPSGYGKGSGGTDVASPPASASPELAESITAEAPTKRVRSGSVTVASTGSLAGGKVTEYTNNKNTGGVEQGEDE